MHCLSFLKALKEHLDVEVEVEVEVVGTLAKNKLSQNERDEKNKKKNILKKTPQTGHVGTRTDGLHLMTTLALTYAHMSRNTVLTLEVHNLNFHIHFIIYLPFVFKYYLPFFSINFCHFLSINRIQSAIRAY